MMLFGFVLGLRHALEADHVAAVAAMATRTSSRREMLRLALGWGTGHTLTLLVMGALVLAAGTAIPDGSERFLDRIVGAVLLVMGAGVLRRAWLSRVDLHVHEHSGGLRHLHLHHHGTDGAHDHSHRTPGRALAMGTLHGLAGSGPLLLLMLPQSHSAAGVLANIAIFGIGSIGGMLLFSMALSLPLRAGARIGGPALGLQMVLGSATVLVGVRALVM
jgi:ABC-type nickel/cobalt efflux system permease component RcnA